MGFVTAFKKTSFVLSVLERAADMEAYLGKDTCPMLLEDHIFCKKLGQWYYTLLLEILQVVFDP